MLSESERQEAADELWKAHEARAPIVPLTVSYPDIDVVDAYDIQVRNIARRVEAGAVTKGHKVGLSAKAMQELLGVDEPDYGHLVDDMFAYEADSLAIDRFCQPRAEIEVAFVLGRPLAGPGVTVADVVRATEYLLPSIEIVDSRVADWNVRIQDTIADNASSGAVVLGGRPTRLPDLDVALMGAVLRGNGQVLETGCGGAVLGNPVTAIAWLANKVASFGIALEAGQVVMPGSCVRMVPVDRGDTINADFDVLGHVSITFI